ncbi:MAG: carboxypeptidase regulatory-like domain-containing protein, partial [Bryobacteraceae bacterium]|nr:carboxypeptidase regulatory-like domain-containing protein [Bryobacteraceae bacterium]
IDRQIGELRLPAAEKNSLSEFLSGMRGTRIEVRSGTTVMTGRLLSVERKTRVTGTTTVEVDYLSLMTDSGELRTTELSPASSVKLLEEGLPGKVNRLLDLVSSGREADVRRMVISTSGTGERSVFVSYISEVPVWKSTYRIVMGAKPGQPALLQGWAIVDNTVGQDWNAVDLSLIAGAPQSFIQNLSQPYYSRRPVMALPVAMNSAPQTYEPTLVAGGARVAGVVYDASGGMIAGATVRGFSPDGAIVAETMTGDSGSYTLSGLPDGPVRVQVLKAGFLTATQNLSASAGVPANGDFRMEIGSVAESVDVAASAPDMRAKAAMPRSMALGSGRALGTGEMLRNGFGGGVGAGMGAGVGGGTYRMPPENTAKASELGDLFEYKLKQPITIGKNRSALVPIMQTEIAGEKVSVWNEQAGSPRPKFALWLLNSSGLTLDGGSFSVLEEDTFAGEGIFEQIRPGEKRLISYATDLGVIPDSKTGSDPQRATRVLVRNGIMTHFSEIREKKTYTFRNEDKSARTMIVEHPVRPGFELRSSAEPAEKTSAYYRFRLPIPSKQTASLTVDEGRKISSTYFLTNVTSDQVIAFVNQRSLNKKVEDSLRNVLTQKEVVNGLNSRKKLLEGESREIFDDQQRLRENLKALKGSAEEKSLVQRYTQQLAAQETRLESLKKELAEVGLKQAAAQEELSKVIAAVDLDEQL